MKMAYSRFLNDIGKRSEGSSIRKLYDMEMNDMISLGAGKPNPATFPLLSGSLKMPGEEQLTLTPALLNFALQYSKTDGYPPLVEKLKSLTLRLHNPPRWQDTRLIVTSGSQNGVHAALSLMMNVGDYVIIEEPNYCGTISIFQQFLPKWLPVAVDNLGMRPDALRALLSRWRPEDVCHTTTAVPKALPASYLSMDTDGRVLRFDSFSKTIGGGLRVGYVTGPEPLVRKILYHLHVSIMHTSGLSQLNKSGGLIAEGIVSSMKRRENVLLDNKILLAAVYLDPMNRILLDNDRTSKGKEALYEIAVRIKEMKSQTEIHEPEQVRNIDKSSSSDSDSASSNKEIDFDSYLDTIEQAKVKRHRSENAAAVDIKNTRFQQDFFGALMEVKKFDRSSKVTVEEAIPAYPEIVKDVARAVTAMPPTQVKGITDADKLLHNEGRVRKVSAVPGCTFMTDENKPCPYMRLSFSFVSKEKMEVGIQRIALAIKDYHQNKQ
ncbi:Kynurenine/alpha-aminoadipate aminotransferase-like 2 [Homarus americanus]|uniref:Kynurenine/alpha-aminoadipate aminotransferase-like 2 n=1 Tax=Homarus americanus TaxID=6706 RepID=A0A8J5JLZ2_HOMAM|nr:Kynurenine/alpha-aminoadipate aminotransferase-like 2 [Homarus americanus]